MTTSEYYGAGTRATRTPAVYWAILEPKLPGLCQLQRKDWGVIASSEGLATAYPVIAATRTGAVLAYSYSGAGTISEGRYPAFPGEGHMVGAGMSFGCRINPAALLCKHSNVLYFHAITTAASPCTNQAPGCHLAHSNPF